ALDEYDRESPWINARETGEGLLKRLGRLAGKKGALKSIAGRGLLVSLKFASEEVARAFCARAAGHGLMVETGRVDGSCVLLRPSLLIGKEEESFIADAVKKTLGDL
ncbi:MAG TPA: aminotransferase class III-fold pyridoxal phosphate-dependent enzyme, partial [Deltaproteobacteria bacterium]|nr:aminotransferase class III-fold pyridoxal phosphate-dependent enzyme [Deltaproteobacteria bacterium]